MPDQQEKGGYAPIPPLDFDVAGWTPLPKRRVRQAWFRAVLEELWEHRDGSREWRISKDVIPIGELIGRTERPPPLPPSKDD